MGGKALNPRQEPRQAHSPGCLEEWVKDQEREIPLFFGFAVFSYCRKQQKLISVNQETILSYQGEMLLKFLAKPTSQIVPRKGQNKPRTQTGETERHLAWEGL